MDQADFILSKADIRQARFVTRPAPALKPGEARLKIDAFAMTSNNVSYAVFADFAGYWNFFPAEDEADGRVPFWGFATVAESTLETLPVGARVYGYFPASSELVVQPGAFDPYGFTDQSAHRDGLPAFYNRYHLTETDIAYDPNYEDVQMLVRPLYATGWLIDDMLMSRDTPPAHVIVSSASSKTALAYAHKAKAREGLMLTGLTSPGNVGFVEGTGFYDHVVSYGDLGALQKAGPAIFCDFYGDPALRPQLAGALGEALVANITIGGTNWDADRSPGAMIGEDLGPDTEFFFAPTHADICAKRMGGAAFAQALNSDMCAFYPIAGDLVTPERRSGQEAILQGWQDTIDAKVPPERGLIFSV